MYVMEQLNECGSSNMIMQMDAGIKLNWNETASRIANKSIYTNRININDMGFKHLDFGCIKLLANI